MAALIGLLVFAAVVAANFAGMIAATSFLGPKRPNPVKDEPFECGSLPVGPGRVRMHIRYYLTAILFLVFDIEIVFLYPFIVIARRELGAYGFGVMGIFFALLAFGLVYEWRRGGMEWD
jgi:NADH-quinone oxidoreductase subunit A